MDAPPATRAEILKLLAATRSTWKGIQQAGLDVGMGTIEDVHQVTLVIQGLYRKAYDIDRQYGLYLTGFLRSHPQMLPLWTV